jgi:hypothetical protein
MMLARAYAKGRASKAIDDDEEDKKNRPKGILPFGGFFF